MFMFDHVGDFISLVTMVPRIKNAIDSSTNAKELGEGLAQLAPIAIPALERIAEDLFPNLRPHLRVVAGALAAFDPNKTLWVQRAINKILPSANVVEDGIYGADTYRGVMMLQEHFGLRLDGFAGDITKTAIRMALSQIFGSEEQVAQLATAAKMTSQLA
jgi:peptidoglycan hydrolase-like protein with peptidoglycan-binding domain